MNFQRSTLAAMTNRINQTSLNLSNSPESARSQIKETEMKQLRKTAAMLTNMYPPDVAVMLREQSNPIQSAKLLYYMQTLERTKIMSELNNGTEQDKELAKKILEALIRVEEDIHFAPDDQ